jgi:hypothetical protein
MVRMWNTRTLHRWAAIVLVGTVLIGSAPAWADGGCGSVFESSGCVQIALLVATPLVAPVLLWSLVRVIRIIKTASDSVMKRVVAMLSAGLATVVNIVLAIGLFEWVNPPDSFWMLLLVPNVALFGLQHLVHAGLMRVMNRAAPDESEQ